MNAFCCYTAGVTCWIMNSFCPLYSRAELHLHGWFGVQAGFSKSMKGLACQIYCDDKSEGRSGRSCPTMWHSGTFGLKGFESDWWCACFANPCGIGLIKCRRNHSRNGFLIWAKMATLIEVCSVHMAISRKLSIASPIVVLYMWTLVPFQHYFIQFPSSFARAPLWHRPC